MTLKRFLLERPFDQLLVVPIGCTVLVLVGLLIYNSYSAKRVISELKAVISEYELMEQTADSVDLHVRDALLLFDENVTHPPVDSQSLLWMVADVEQSLGFLKGDDLKQALIRQLRVLQHFHHEHRTQQVGLSSGHEDQLPERAEQAVLELLFLLDARFAHAQQSGDYPRAMQLAELQIKVFGVQKVLQELLNTKNSHHDLIQQLLATAKSDLAKLRGLELSGLSQGNAASRVDRSITQLSGIVDAFFRAIADSGDLQMALVAELKQNRLVVQADLLSGLPFVKEELHQWHRNKSVQFETALKARQQREVVIGLLLFVLIAGVLGYLVWTLKWRVNRLVKAANRFADGSLQHRCHLPVADEFGVLARAMNQMAAAIDQKQQVLEHLVKELRNSEHEVWAINQTLELKIQQRTQTLQDTLEALEAENQRRKEAEQRLEHLAFYDALTGLPNRALFYERLRHCAATHRRSQHEFALLFIDLDRFKAVNDSLGHEAGDLLLKAVAERLVFCVPRETDTVARLGGDEFTVILTDVVCRAAIAKVCQRIIDCVKQPVVMGTQSAEVGCSIGIAYSLANQQDVSVLCRHADAAMYQAKASGRNCWCAFEESEAV